MQTTLKSSNTVLKRRTLNSVLYVFIALLICLFAVLLVRSAWLSDDSYISFRVTDNFLNGYGLRYNIAERVQAFTNPLWTIVIIIPYYLSGNMYYSALGLSAFFSILTVLFLIYGLARSRLTAIVGILLCLVSKSFIDFSTSGLENPMSHFLIIIFLLLYLKMRPRLFSVFTLSMITSAAFLTRPDNILIFLPPLAYYIVCLHKDFKRRRLFYAFFIGLLPAIAWELFSLFYYGFPFPNTAYAKLAHGIPQVEMLLQGLYYLLNSLRLDPITLSVISFSMLMIILTKKWHLLPFLVSIVLSLLYTVYIGGDFMSGRFLSTLFILSVGMLTVTLFQETKTISLLVLIVLLIGISTPRSPVTSGLNYAKLHGGPRWHFHGIVDQRSGFFDATNPLRIKLGGVVPDSKEAKKGIAIQKKGPNVVVKEALVGFYGFYAGPQVHIVETLALTDPLLARLPANPKYRNWRTNSWRIGHIERKMPKGYYETLKTGKNHIKNPQLAEYFEKIMLITRGPLFSKERILTILKFNLGLYDNLLAAYTEKTSS